MSLSSSPHGTSSQRAELSASHRPLLYSTVPPQDCGCAGLTPFLPGQEGPGGALRRPQLTLGCDLEKILCAAGKQVSAVLLTLLTGTGSGLTGCSLSPATYPAALRRVSSHQIHFPEGG